MLAATAYPISFDAGRAVVRRGRGGARPLRDRRGRGRRRIGGEPVGVIGADDVVGERGVILDATRAATVTATSHIITFAISRDLLRQVLDGSPQVVESMRDHVRQRYS